MDARVHSIVDAANNCEDIAMNFLASTSSGRGPLHVQAKARDYGDSRNFLDETVQVGLGVRPSHVQHRRECIAEFAKIFNSGPMPSAFSLVPPEIEQSFCASQNGILFDCNKGAHSTPHADLGSFTTYAYAIVAATTAEVIKASSYARDIRKNGAYNDIVLITCEGCLGAETASHTHFFDRMLQIKCDEDKKSIALRINSWALVDYEKVLVAGTPFENKNNVLSDFIFKMEPFAAPPDINLAGSFDPRIMLIKPDIIWHRHLQSLMHRARRGDIQTFFNSAFSNWHVFHTDL